MEHIYVNNKNNKTLILLHGTGGDEYQLLSVGKKLAQEANLLGIRGNVIESGLNRYFKRLKIGYYDIPNYKEETLNLSKAIKEFSVTYHFNLKEATIVGFSNGANIALGLLQTNPLVNNYILYSPDYINKEENFPNLENINIFLSTADNDPYVNVNNMNLLIKRLKDKKANLHLYKTSGHQINSKVLNDSVNWYQKLNSKKTSKNFLEAH